MRAHPHSLPNRFPSQEKFLRTLTASMHQMAQPLSTIQASLELALLSPTTAEQYQELAQDALRHLQGAVESMQFAARLARFQQPAGDVRDVLLSTALEEVISDLQRTLDTAQLQLLFFRSEHEQLIRISPTRLRQMLFYVLQALQDCSQPGDLVHIEIHAPVGHLLLRIQHSQLKNDQVDCAKPPHEGMGDRALALAEAIVSGAGGEFSVTTYPFLIVADFPVKRESRAGAIGKNKLSDLASSQLAVSSHRLFKMS